jgi:pimeloyl-ACP methyl ester carboxylesterase
VTIPVARFTATGAGGVRIAADRRGDRRAAAVIFLHGGGQTRRSWAHTAAAISQRGWQTVTMDLRGHGESDWAEDGDYRVTSFADDVLAVMDQLPPRPVLIGASLGGLTALLLGGERAPHSVGAIVLVDIVPEMDFSGAMRVHGFMNERMATGFDTLAQVADAIQQYNPLRQRPTDFNGLRANLRRRGGRWYWHWDPKFIDGTAAYPPLEIVQVDRMNRAVEAIVGAGVPVLLVRGRQSDLVTNERAQTFLGRFPQVEFVDVEGAGHMVAGDRNDVFADAVATFLDRHRIND